MIQLGPQLYTVREFTQTAEGIENTFQICHENHYETVQISGFAPLPVEVMTSLLEKYEISVCCTHSSFDRMQEDLNALIDEHKFCFCAHLKNYDNFSWIRLAKFVANSLI